MRTVEYACARSVWFGQLKFPIEKLFTVYRYGFVLFCFVLLYFGFSLLLFSMHLILFLFRFCLHFLRINPSIHLYLKLNEMTMELNEKWKLGTVYYIIEFITCLRLPSCFILIQKLIHKNTRTHQHEVALFSKWEIERQNHL